MNSNIYIYIYIYILQQCKSACVSALTGSVPNRLAEGLQKVSEPFKNWVHVARLTMTCLKHLQRAISSFWSSKKNGIWLVTTCNLEMIFCMQYCHSWIAQVEYQGQTQYTRILDSKPFIDTCCHIGYRLELKYLHFVQFLLNAHWAADWPHKSEKWELEI